VKSGDTLSAIAKSQGTSVDSLVNLNNLPDANILHIGQILKISYSLDNNPENNTKINYISRYVPEEVKQAIMKHLGVENSNTIAAISYSRSHIALPAGSTSADIDKNKNIVHIKTTTKPEAIRQRQKTSEKHKTDEKGTAKSALTPGKFEPIVIFSVSNKLQDLVTSKSLKILKEIMKNANIHKITITSTLRTAEKQADAMYANMQSKGIQSQLDYYSSAGREVIKSAIDAGGNDLDKIRQVKSAMVGKIVSLQNDGRLVSRHCVSEDMYATRNVFDISKHFSTKQSVQLAFDEALTNYAKNNDGFKYISPFIHRGEPAFHVEIEQ
ncbi:LysM peptidoglycan-binding domain-containing protein, partial [Rahnella perminowiae]|uniref:LysM peptidoglycan-binding domain-containing protein n=1 Tax=Rahnella perminowiae TaxID=2816244 RepID=UPI001C260952